MKATEFVKKYGWDHAKLHIENMEAVQIGNNHQEYIDSLKTLVNAYELVGQFDDIDQAKAYLPDIDNDIPWSVNGKELRFFKWQLEEAIELVESVNE